MYTYGLFMLMYGRNHHSRSSNYPLIKKKKTWMVTISTQQLGQRAVRRSASCFLLASSTSVCRRCYNSSFREWSLRRDLNLLSSSWPSSSSRGCRWKPSSAEGAILTNKRELNFWHQPRFKGRKGKPQGIGTPLSNAGCFCVRKQAVYSPCLTCCVKNKLPSRGKTHKELFLGFRAQDPSENRWQLRQEGSPHCWISCMQRLIWYFSVN